MLAESSTAFTDLGQDEISGGPATHYQGTVDLNAVLGKLTGTAKAEIESLLKKSNGATVPYNVWIGANGYVRQVEMQIKGNAGLQGMTLGLISELSDYGKPVSIDLPPADQVTELSLHQMSNLGAAVRATD